jgi:prepilin-type N-terminal cleavage/methylation domain-containing protein
MKTNINKRGFTLIELSIVVVIIGIIAAIALPNFASMLANAKEASVKSNSHSVQVAAEDFATQNDGMYAKDLAATTSVSGETILDLLPQNSPLRNPFTGVKTEPIDGAAATSGQTGYEPVLDGGGNNVGYVITGYGRTDIVTRLSNGN